jgi:chemotaxis protein methyltransferase CheR
VSPVLSDQDFQAVRDYLSGTAGLVFDDSRRPGLTSVINERLTVSGASSVPAYLALLQMPKGADERQHLIDAVTVQETYFFRNPPQMEALRRKVLPELLRRTVGRERPLTIWSAGCSTGEEPYTLAMLLLELSPMLGVGSRTTILATDVSAEALAAAKRGVYSGRTLDTAPATLRDRWFEPTSGGGLAVKDEVRRLVHFQSHNLVHDQPPFTPGEVDLIVCRNVTIYFARDTTRALIGQFHRVLAEGGYLLLGHSETLWQVSEAFTLVPVGDAFVYRRSPVSRAPLSARLPRAVRAAQAARVRAAAAPRPRRVPAPVAPSLEAARLALVQGRYDDAASIAAALVEGEPLSAEAYVVLGHALSTLGRDGDAVEPLRKAVYLDPTAGHAHFMLAGSLARLGQNGQAAVSYRAAARSLEGVDRDALAAFLDGREVEELVDLCRRLADISVETDLGEDRLASGGRGA